MKLDEFTEDMIWKLQKELGNGYKIKKQTLDGLNSTKKHSLFVAAAGSSIVPCINMDEYYGRYQKGEPFCRLFQTVLSECTGTPPFGSADVSGFSCWDSVKPRIFAKLINTERNQGLLQKVPHRQYLDLSLVYYVRINTGEEDIHGSILIHNEHMQIWKTGEDTLYRTAWKNISDADETMLKDINSVLAQLLDINIFAASCSRDGCCMYVLGSRSLINGAVQMCSQQTLKKAAEVIGSDFWILPSSIHELILVPVYSIEGDAQELAEMVRDINDTQLRPYEILSYHVYRYSRDTETLSIAA